MMLKQASSHMGTCATVGLHACCRSVLLHRVLDSCPDDAGSQWSSVCDCIG